MELLIVMLYTAVLSCISNFIPLQLENMFCIISIFSNLLGLVLCPRIGVILENVQVHLRRMFILLFLSIVVL